MPNNFVDRGFYNGDDRSQMAPVGHFTSRRWTVIASGLLIGALALVVTFTGQTAFFSPVAIMVVAAIGLAAAMLQLRLRSPERDHTWHPVALVLNVAGIICAVVALFGVVFRLTPRAGKLTALAAVGCFAVSGAILLHRFRKQSMRRK